jgi:hypothetical protein
MAETVAVYTVPHTPSFVAEFQVNGERSQIAQYFSKIRSTARERQTGYDRHGQPATTWKVTSSSSPTNQRPDAVGCESPPRCRCSSITASSAKYHLQIRQIAGTNTGSKKMDATSLVILLVRSSNDGANSRDSRAHRASPTPTRRVGAALIRALRPSHRHLVSASVANPRG